MKYTNRMVLTAAVLGGLMSPSTQAKAPHDPYVVQTGDTAWGLAQTYYGNGAQWTSIIAYNPSLGQEDRLSHIGGKTIVKLVPGDTLEGLTNTLETDVTGTPLPRGFDPNGRNSAEHSQYRNIFGLTAIILLLFLVPMIIPLPNYYGPPKKR